MVKTVTGLKGYKGTDVRGRMELMQASFDDAFPDIPLLEFRFRDLPDPPSAAWFLNPI